MQIRFFALFFVIALVTVTSDVSQAQPLEGAVYDAGTFQPVAEASVYWQEENRLESTDTKGHFQFDNDMKGSAITLVIFAEGYTTTTVTVEEGRNQLIKVYLDPLEVEIASVDVNASAFDTYATRSLRNVEGTAIYAAKKSEVIQIDRLLGNLAANNAREVYKGIAGLNIWENDGSGIQLNIGARGLDPNRTSHFNTRQNGYDISADALGYPESYYTPPTQALDRIEIVRGAASLQYGAQFGGLLNFVMKQGPEDKVVEIVSENTAGSFGFLSTFNSVGGTKGKLNYYTFHNFRRGDGWRPNAGFNQHIAYARLAYEWSPKLQLGLEYTFMDYRAQQPGGLTDFEFEADPRQSKRARNWFQVNWNLAAVYLDYRISSRTRLNSRSFLLVAGRDALGELGPINRPDPQRQRDLVQGNYENFGNETRLMHRYMVNGRPATFLVGTRYYRGYSTSRQGFAGDGSGPDFEFLNPQMPEWSDYEFPSRNMALFAEQLFNLSDRWTLTPGIRFEHIRTASQGYYRYNFINNRNEIEFFRRFESDRSNERSFVLAGIGSGYKPAENLEVYANVSQNYRAINFSDLAIINPNLIVDSLLQDESGFNADLGLRGTLLKGVVRIDASLFYLRYQDRIGLQKIKVPDPVIEALEVEKTFRTNVGDARVIGLEAYAEADLWALIFGSSERTALSIFANMSWLDGKYLAGNREFAGNDVELIPPVSLKAGLTMRHRRFRTSFQYTYVGEHFSDATNARQVADATRGIIPAYAVMDASVAYDFGSISLQGGVNNLSDAAYFTRRATAYPGPGIIPAEGRRFYATLRLEL